VKGQRRGGRSNTTGVPAAGQIEPCQSSTSQNQSVYLGPSVRIPRNNPLEYRLEHRLLGAKGRPL